MTVIDTIILIILVYALFIGFRTGLVMQLTTLVAIGAGIWGAIHFSDITQAWLRERVEFGTLAGPVSFAVTFFLVLVLVKLIGRAISKGLDLAMLSFPNKLAGAVLSGFKYMLITSALVQAANGSGLLLIAMPPEKMKESVLMEPVMALAPIIIPAIRDSPWIHDTVEDLTQELKPVNPE